MSRKYWQDISRWGNFHYTSPISFIKASGFYFRVGVIFEKRTKARKRENNPHAKISTFTAIHSLNICLLRWSSLQTKEGQMRSEFRLDGLENSQTPSTSEVLASDHRENMSTALYRSFLKHCTLTNKAVGAISRDLSKPPQRKQSPYPRPLWLLVGTPLILGHELASRRAEHRLVWRMSLYFMIHCFCHLTCLC